MAAVSHLPCPDLRSPHSPRCPGRFGAQSGNTLGVRARGYCNAALPWDCGFGLETGDVVEDPGVHGGYSHRKRDNRGTRGIGCGKFPGRLPAFPFESEVTRWGAESEDCASAVDVSNIRLLQIDSKNRDNATAV
eukprot:scaffold537_cov241-Pinguiococcus_pyrenoidosus.AAC.8